VKDLLCNGLGDFDITRLIFATMLDHLGFELVGFIGQHEETAVGRQMFENEIHEFFQDFSQGFDCDKSFGHLDQHGHDLFRSVGGFRDCRDDFLLFLLLVLGNDILEFVDSADNGSRLFLQPLFFR